VEGGNVLRRLSVALVPLVLALAACGGDGAGPTETGAASAPSNQAVVLVTEECGREVIVPRTDVTSGQTAMQALDRVAEIETDSGGKFVTAINGVKQDEDQKLAWLYYLNGKMAEKGATEVRLAAGDVEWWDIHPWTKTCRVPANAR
jgi:Domain of unknown function (DUF4430)